MYGHQKCTAVYCFRDNGNLYAEIYNADIQEERILLVQQQKDIGKVNGYLLAVCDAFTVGVENVRVYPRDRLTELIRLAEIALKSELCHKSLF
jgi:hypothetical protein